MTGPAIAMMVVAAVVIWGGLIAAATFLIRNPLSTDPHPHDDHDFDQDSVFEP